MSKCLKCKIEMIIMIEQYGDRRILVCPECKEITFVENKENGWFEK